MKPGGASPLGRNAVRERHKHGRAASPALRERYPSISTVQLDFDFSDRTEFLPSPQVMVFHPPARAFFRFECPYTDCDGEFDLEGAVDAAILAEEPKVEGEARCPGTRHGGSPCTLCMDYVITCIPRETR